MIKATIAKLPKYTAKMITFIDTTSTPPLEMGKEACQRTRGAFGHSKEPGTWKFNSGFYLWKSAPMLILKIKPGFRGSVLKIKPNFELVPGNSNFNQWLTSD